MNIQILKGSLLGDAYIQKYKNRPNSYSLSFQQSEFQYAKWKAEMTGLPYTLTKRKRYDKRTKKYYYIYNVYLKCDKDIKENLYTTFYTPKKEVSKELLKSLSALSICIWYLDDGNLYYNGNNCHLTLSVDGFNKESKDNIINYFSKNYNITFKKHQNRIRITSVKEAKLFMKIVEKFIPKYMKRKSLKYIYNKYGRNKKR